MAYQVLARKCRPQRFSEIVGQEHIARTLQNAIAQDRVGHAYLFVGSRGIGKTTTARIFAKALNCEAGTVREPCCECQSCREISSGASLDVTEIDGASHNKVEHVRDLRDNVQYAPTRSRYKIYIIDEVHMLSTQAWNALLKTLEEPPSHVKFFFATTEPHKVLPTIVSRCQRFDLKRIPVSLIVRRLREIADSERIGIDDRALVAVARAADGAMRDAQSIFDQIIAFCHTGDDDGAAIGEADVIDVFGLASGQELKQLTAAILADDVQGAVRVVHDLADRGRDLERLFGDLVYFIRNLMICQVCKDPRSLLDISETEVSDLAEISKTADAKTVQRVLDGLVSEERALRAALNKRVYLEVALVRVMQAANSVQIGEVIERLNELRKGGPYIPAVDRTAVANAPSPRDPAPCTGDAAAHAQPQAAPAAQQNPATAPPENPAQAVAPTEPDTVSADQSADTSEHDAQSATDLSDATKTADDEDDARDHSVPEVRETEKPDIGRHEPAACDTTEQVVAEAPADDDFVEQQAATAAAPPGTADQPRTGVFDQTADPADVLASLIGAVSELPDKQFLKVAMDNLRPTSFDGNVLQVAYDDDVAAEHLDLLQRPDNLADIEQCLAALCTAATPRLLIKRWIEGVSNQDEKRRLVSSPEARERAEKNPFVQQTLELFGGEIIDARG